MRATLLNSHHVLRIKPLLDLLGHLNFHTTLYGRGYNPHSKEEGTCVQKGTQQTQQEDRKAGQALPRSA